MKQHTATKIQIGEYIYRGHHILRASDHYDSNYIHWNITNKVSCKYTGLDSFYTGDSTNTLAEAKDMVDGMIECGTSNDEGYLLV